MEDLEDDAAPPPNTLTARHNIAHLAERVK